MKPKNMTTLSIGNSISRSPLRRGFLLIPLALALVSFALSPTAQAVVPAPDGGYTGQNTAEGTDALFNLGGGINNTATGFEALFFNDTGSDNTANGSLALFNNTTGFNNTATGFQALLHNITGGSNTANGVNALFSNDTGGNNTANGSAALQANTTGHENTANGADALIENTTGFNNTANGFSALFFNDTGSDNTANGLQALLNNTTGLNNTANGEAALRSNTTGSNNTADGFQALQNNTGGSNIGLGASAGINLTTGSSNIEIGNAGVAGESAKIRIGTKPAQKATFIAGISGVTVANGVGVIINPQGQLGTVVSSERYKDEIKQMDKASEAILALKPVTFRYKHELDPEGIPQFGLVAEQVEKVNPDLVARDDQGKAYTVRYEAVNAMLLNEFLKEHRTVQELKSTVAKQETTIAQQQKGMEVLAARFKEQESKIQKVSDQLELKKAAPQTVANNP
jgi:hypothetical protein